MTTVRGSEAKKGLMPGAPTRSVGQRRRRKPTIYKVKNKILLMDERDGTKKIKKKTEVLWRKDCVEVDE